MTILSHGTKNVHSPVWQRFCHPATQCAVTGLGHKTVSKILWTTCLTSLLVQENIPSCCFFPYLELPLLPSLISYGTMYYFIRDLSHTSGTVRNSNFVKQVKYKEHIQQY